MYLHSVNFVLSFFVKTAVHPANSSSARFGLEFHPPSSLFAAHPKNAAVTPLVATPTKTLDLRPFIAALTKKG